jgi:Flp pilus assembly pilin Flp
VGHAIRIFIKERYGQDLAEYCLLIALIMLAGAGILLHLSGGMQNLWSVANNSIAAGGTTGGGNATASTPNR